MTKIVYKMLETVASERVHTLKEILYNLKKNYLIFTHLSKSIDY